MNTHTYRHVHAHIHAHSFTANFLKRFWKVAKKQNKSNLLKKYFLTTFFKQEKTAVLEQDTRFYLQVSAKTGRLQAHVSIAINNNNNNCIERHKLRFLQSPHCAASRLQHVRSSAPCTIVCNILSAYHVQLAVYHLVRRDSSTIKFDRV